MFVVVRKTVEYTQTGQTRYKLVKPFHSREPAVEDIRRRSDSPPPNAWTVITYEIWETEE